MPAECINHAELLLISALKNCILRVDKPETQFDTKTNKHVLSKS
ncbi:MAG: hypothetical protein P8L36_01680 [SAR324 cluster bacterium]|nr:hypothetical protein [SAR324 cluster bacterium]